MIVTLHREHGHKRFRGLGLKRPERSCRRWQLEFCSWIYEESYPLGMRQATSQPPSKPMHPRFLQVLQGFWGQCWQKAGTNPAQRREYYGNLPEQSRVSRRQRLDHPRAQDDRSDR